MLCTLNVITLGAQDKQRGRGSRSAVVTGWHPVRIETVMVR
jgi:hypothetical protein